MEVRIEVNDEQMAKLQEVFPISRVAIYDALKCKTKNNRSRQIRFAAVNNDAKVWQVVEDKQIIRKIIQ